MGMVILGEICTYSKGLGISRENTDENKEIPYLHYGDLYKKYDFRVNIDDIADTIIKIDNSPKIKEDQFLKDGDIVYTLTSETVDDLGHSTLVINKTQRPFVAGMETTIIRVSDRETVLPEFLNYVFQSRTFKERLHQYVTGMKVFRVHPKDLLKIPIDIPPIDSQHRIVKILNNISDLMDVNKKINDYLLELANRQLEYALSINSKQIALRDLVDLENSKRIPLNKKQREEHRGTYPYYGATSIMDYVDDYLFDGVRVLLGEDGSVITDEGYPVLQYVWGKYWVNNHAHILKSKGKYPLEMIYLALRKSTISHLVTGAVQMKISQSNLNSMVLDMPESDSMPMLTYIFDNYRNNIDMNQNLVQLRDYLLPRLMSGMIDVSNLEPDSIS